MTRDETITLLEDYSIWLTKNGYMDTDWKDEEPYAVEEIIKLLGFESPLEDCKLDLEEFGKNRTAINVFEIITEDEPNARSKENS